MKLSLPFHLRTGVWGEAQAEQFLKAKGYRILGRRVHVTARDELDLVARDGDVIVFVEVKTRKTESFGAPLTAVDRAKRHTTSRAAVRYLQRVKFPNVYIRFDVVEVVGQEGDINPVVRHIENAFTLDPQYRLPI